MFAMEDAWQERIEGSYDLYLTQRLILQPQIELNFYSQADPGRGIGTGFSDLDGGLRLGYQFSRKFAPYIGYTYTGAFGQTATFSRQAGEPTSARGLYLGLGCGTDRRVWPQAACDASGSVLLPDRRQKLLCAGFWEAADCALTEGNSLAPTVSVVRLIPAG